MPSHYRILRDCVITQQSSFRPLEQSTLDKQEQNFKMIKV